MIKKRPRKPKLSPSQIEGLIDDEITGFFSKAARFWFELMQWLLVLGALQFLRNHIPNPVVWMFYWISLAALMMFIYVRIRSFFHRFADKFWQKILATFFALIVSFVVTVFLKVGMGGLEFLNAALKNG